MSLVILYHHFVQPIFKDSDISHEGTLFNESKFILFNFFEFILETVQGIFLCFSFVSLLVQLPAQVIDIPSPETSSLGKTSRGVAVGRERPPLSSIGDELIPQIFEMSVLSSEFFYFLSIFLFDLFCLLVEVLPIFIQNLRLLSLLLDFSLNIGHPIGHS